MSRLGDGIDRRSFLRGAMAAGAVGIAGGPGALAGLASPQAEADAFLSEFIPGWLPLQTAAAEADWAAATDVSEAHTAAKVARNLELNRYAGAPEVIDTVVRLLARREALDDRTARQLEKIRLDAAEAPGTVPEVVKARTEAEAKQSATQDGFAYTLRRGSRARRRRRPTTSTASSWSRATWPSARPPGRPPRTIGRPLRDGLLRLRDLRNKVARAMGFDNFFALQVADYGMTVPEMLALCDRLIDGMRPLYGQLHAWASHALAKRYGAEAPRDGRIPAHWLPNRWGQDWPGLVEGIDMDEPFKGKPKEFITEQAERFYISIGFPRLPSSFWEKSDLYPADPKSGRKKNSHASAWHIDLAGDVRSLMSIEPNSRWFGTTHHELGHIYYYISYSTPAGAVPAARGGQPGLSRGDRRPDRPGRRPAAVSEAGRPAEPRGREGRRGHLPARPGARRLIGRVPALVGRRDDPVRARLLRRAGRRRRPQRRLVGAGRALPGDRAAGRAARDPLRPGHQDPHQRRPRRSITTTRSPPPSSSSSTTTSPARSSSRTLAIAIITARSRSATSSAASSRSGRRATGKPCSARRPARGSRPARWPRTSRRCRNGSSARTAGGT